MRRLPATLIVIALVAAGCNSGSAVTGESLRGARLKTREAKTARFALVVAITAGGGSNSTSTTGKPEVVELRVKGLWNMQDDLVRSKVSYSTSAGGTGADYIIIKRVVYVSGLQAPKGKWRAFEGTHAGVGDDGLGVLRPDPVLEMLAGLAKTATKMGGERLDGTETTHYRGVADLKRASREAEIDARPALRSRLASTEGTAAKLDVWLDKQGRVRRLVTFTTAKDGQSTIRTTLDLTAFGVRAIVAAPKAADIHSPPPGGS